MDLRRGGKLVILCLVIASALGQPLDGSACVEAACPGPLQFYREFNCTPVYKNEEKCCAYKYNCDHLESRSAEKCYFNGNEYNIGEKLWSEDFSCDFHCVCHKNDWDTIATFACLTSDYGYYLPQPHCYVPRTVDCRQHEVVCPKTPEERPTCLVDGKVYKVGEEFTPEAEPNKMCFCGANYTGENIEPFCKIKPEFRCNTELFNGPLIKRKCAPVYDKEPTTDSDCISDFLCPNHDNIIPKTTDPSLSQKSNLTCQLGHLTMQFGDKFYQKTSFPNACVKCVCEIPPFPTCRKQVHEFGVAVDCEDLEDPREIF